MSKILDGTEVISAVAIKIRNEFTLSEIPAIYKDTPIQNIQKPCIFINKVSTIQLPRMRNKANRTYLVDIIVTNSDDNITERTWFTQIEERLLRVVDTITIDNQIVRMTQGESHIEGGELHLVVTYNFGVLKLTDDEDIKMQTQKYKGRVI